MSTPSVNACLDILRRTPIEQTEENLFGLSVLLSNNNEAVNELYQRVDVPLKDAVDPSIDGGKKYIICDHNRDGDSYRSPWSNMYYPALPEEDHEGFKPRYNLREIEIQANDVFESYCELYYGIDAISSVYLWDSTITGRSSDFSACFLIKKSVPSTCPDVDLQGGFWNSIHVVDVNLLQEGKPTFRYQVSSTVVVSLDIHQESKASESQTQIVGSMTKTVEKTCAISPNHVADSHIANIGKMIEDIEIDIRSSMDSLCIQKTKEVFDSIRCDSADRKRHGFMATIMAQQGDHQKQMQAAMLARGILKQGHES